MWSQRWIKFQEAEAVICHLEADAADADKDVDEQEHAYDKARVKCVKRTASPASGSSGHGCAKGLVMLGYPRE